MYCVAHGKALVYTDTCLRDQATAGRSRLRVRREESPVFIGQHAG